MRAAVPGLGALCAAVILSACATAPDPVLAPAGRGDEPLTRLRGQIDAALAAPGLERATWGIAVRSLDRHDTLYALNPDTLLLPASGMKIVTLAAAADRLGWGHAYETTVFGTGPIVGGVLQGDLVVSGTGDPAIDDWDGAATELFGTWAAHLGGRGIRAIAGRLVGDDDHLDDEALGPGWAWDDLAFSYSAAAGALQFNQNTVRLMLDPGPDPGDPGRVAAVSPSHGLTIRNGLTTAPPGTSAAITVLRRPSSAAVEIGGTIPQDSPTLYRNVSAGNPTILFVETLRAALIGHGIDIQGAAADIDDLAEPPSRTGAARLLTYTSPPLAVLAATMMRQSQNLYAETLLRTLGREADGRGSLEAGQRAMGSVLESWQIAPDAVRVADGSGLSRYNLATAGAFVEVLTRVDADSRLRGPFRAALAGPGIGGTLDARFAGTAAESSVRAKTGSLSTARSLSGYVNSADGEPLAFAILVNNFAGPGSRAEAAIDAIVVRLAEFNR